MTLGQRRKRKKKSDGRQNGDPIKSLFSARWQVGDKTSAGRPKARASPRSSMNFAPLDVCKLKRALPRASAVTSGDTQPALWPWRGAARREMSRVCRRCRRADGRWRRQRRRRSAARPSLSLKLDAKICKLCRRGPKNASLRAVSTAAAAAAATAATTAATTRGRV